MAIPMIPKNLKAFWERKLKQEGLGDIEDDQRRLTDHKTSYDFSQRIGFRQDIYKSIQDYYRWVEHSLQWAQFQSRTDEIIWIMHSEGKSSRDISKIICLAQNTVCLRIKKIRTYVTTQEPRCSE